MKRSLLTVATLGVSLLGAGYMLGQQSQSKSGVSVPSITPPAAAAPVRNKLVKIATLNGTQVNREFQNNVQLMQAQRQKAVELNSEIEKEKDPKKKAELKTQFDQLLAKLNDDNAKMAKAYGFSLARDYVLEIEVSNIYLVATEEEAAMVEADIKKAEAEKAKKK